MIKIIDIVEYILLYLALPIIIGFVMGFGIDMFQIELYISTIIEVSVMFGYLLLITDLYIKTNTHNVSIVETVLGVDGDEVIYKP